MKSFRHLSLGLLLALASLQAPARAQEDPGRAKVGQLEVTVYFATDGDPQAAGANAREISEELRARLISEEKLRFSHYRALGAETQPIFRSYENWAQPLKPSDEILVRFETRIQPQEDSVLLDLELWLARKKILKTDAHLRRSHPFTCWVPEWRGGRLIIAVELAN
ncbi:hypothetical protein HZ994_14100 [Akkermansiaceae bacterium]|nr:hypothetical protein HZ994_14100 [Akkermansiaceae bacterium]